MNAARAASRIRALLKQRDKAEAEIAAQLREQLDALGEAKWLRWCAKEFGWARRTAYRHLNPEKMEEHREQDKRRRAQSRHIEPDDEESNKPGEPEQRLAQQQALLAAWDAAHPEVRGAFVAMRWEQLAELVDARRSYEGLTCAEKTATPDPVTLIRRVK